MNKKTFIFLNFIILSIATFVYLIVDKNYIKEEQDPSPFYIRFNSLKELENFNPITIKGYKIGESQHIDKKSFTTIKVTEVLRNKSTKTIKVGDEIKIWEPYEIIDKGLLPGKIKSNKGLYTEILDNVEYVMFMGWHSQGYYSLGPLEQGKYDLTNSDKKTEEMMNGIVEYHNIKNELLEKYGN